MSQFTSNKLILGSKIGDGATWAKRQTHKPGRPRQLTDGAGHSDAARGPLAGAERRDPPPLDMPAA
jgi:hypothetical protein